MSCQLDVSTLLMQTRHEFWRINGDNYLTEADKKHLKDFYLQSMIAPKARKLLEKHFPEEFGKTASSPAARKTSAHPDR